MFESPTQSPSDRESLTRRRLLDAAGEVFSERGFRDTTIREICTRAGANVAAVNYHFGDKEALYHEVLSYADRCAEEIRSRAITVTGKHGATPETRLRAFVMAYVAAMLDSGRPTWHGRLIAREMADPSPMLDRIIDENIRPRSELLNGIIEELLGPAATAQRVARCKLSVIGQCLIYHCGRHVVERLHPELALKDANVAALAEHIAEFSLRAIESLKREDRAARAPNRETVQARKPRPSATKGVSDRKKGVRR